MTGIRTARKQLTRTKIISAALRLMSNVSLAASVSMREVAKEAGIAPTSFYRHFKDLNEVSLALVEQADELLKQILLEVQSNNRQDETEELRFLVQCLVKNIHNDPELFAFFLGAKYHSAKPVRLAAARVIQNFVNGIADEVERRSMLNRRPITQSKLVADGYAAILFSVGFRAHDMHEDEHPFLIEAMIQQLKMLYVGAEEYSERAEKKATEL